MPDLTLDGAVSSGSIASRTRQELWTLTQTGNWELFKRDVNGNNTFSDSGDFNDDRTHNVVNELTARPPHIIDDDGTDDYTLTDDATGNLAADGENYSYVYDAWYRLRKVLDSTPHDDRPRRPPTTGDPSLPDVTCSGNIHRNGHHDDVDGDGTVKDLCGAGSRREPTSLAICNPTGEPDGGSRAGRPLQSTAAG